MTVSLTGMLWLTSIWLNHHIYVAYYDWFLTCAAIHTLSFPETEIVDMVWNCAKSCNKQPAWIITGYCLMPCSGPVWFTSIDRDLNIIFHLTVFLMYISCKSLCHLLSSAGNEDEWVKEENIILTELSDGLQDFPA